MAEIIGKINSSYKFSVCNHDYSSGKSTIKMPGFSNLRASLTVRSPAADDEFFRRRVLVGGQQRGVHTQAAAASDDKRNAGFRKSLKWWEKGLKPNMKEVTGAQDLVDSLLNAGDKLVIVDFFSPGCGGCKALHPKICQLAEMNPEVEFLQVNHEEHKSMCLSLNVHVLPFFRFYRGAEGRVCSFSCTTTTIKKFKYALAKHAPDRCGLSPTKGLEENELLALASNIDLSFTYTPTPNQPKGIPPVPALAPVSETRLPLPQRLSLKKTRVEPRFLTGNEASCI